MPSLAEWLDIAQRGGTLALGIIFCVGLAKKWWVVGSAYEEVRKERDEWQRLAHPPAPSPPPPIREDGREWPDLEDDEFGMGTTEAKPLMVDQLTHTLEAFARHDDEIQQYLEKQRQQARQEPR
jgi:hypothetical protein